MQKALIFLLVSLVVISATQSERNAVFYKQEGVVNMYPKEEVYPREGGELQLEQLKARLPQYCPPRDVCHSHCH